MDGREKIIQLEKLINKELDDAIVCNRFENICRVIKTETGRDKIFDRVKQMILFEEFDDIQACLTNIENQFFMNE